MAGNKNTEEDTDDFGPGIYADPLEGLDGPEKPEIEIEVVDDRPVEDRVDDEEDSLDEDDELLKTDGMSPEELEQYLEEHTPKGAKQFQRRLGKAHANFHTQRRRADAAERMANEAVKHSKRLMGEIERLRKQGNISDRLFADQATERVNAQLEGARAKLRKAHEEGDTDAMIEANEELNALLYQRNEIASFSSHLETSDQVDAADQGQQPAPPRQAAPDPSSMLPDQNALRWAVKNPWAVEPGNEDMKGVAVAKHSELIGRGIDPNTNPNEYYGEIDKAVRSAFPDRFPSKAGKGDVGDQPATDPAAAARTRTSPVAGASRAGAGGQRPRKVRLSETQLRYCRTLGITPEEMAQQILEEQEAN